MIHHIFPANADHHVLSIIRFVLDQVACPGEQHRFMVMHTGEGRKEMYAGLMQEGEIVFLESHAQLRAAFRRVTRLDCLVLHSMLHGKLWRCLLERPSIWARTIWVAWGGDFHFDAFLHPTSLRQRLRRSWISVITRRLGAVATLVPGDYDVLAGSLGCKGNYARAFYSGYSARHCTMPDQPCVLPHGEPLRVLVGNSAGSSNQHEEVLTSLARFAGQDMQILCPLCYGGSDCSAARERVVKRGKDLFGETFVPLVEFLPGAEYAKLLDSIDVLVFNHNRQQGLGNLYHILFRGKKAFLRAETTTARMLADFGIRVWDTNTISSLSFPEFATMSRADRENNIRLAQEHLSTEAAADCWRQLLDRFRE